MHMNDVYKLLKKKEVTCYGSHASADQNALKLTFLELCSDNHFRCLAKVNKAMFYVITKSFQANFCCGDPLYHFLGI